MAGFGKFCDAEGCLVRRERSWSEFTVSRLLNDYPRVRQKYVPLTYLVLKVYIFHY